MSVTALWWAVIFSGFYHGLNPGMGWPLAVSAALMDRKTSALPKALGALAFGHFLAMTAILLPFSLMIALVEWEVEIRIAAGCIVIALGVYLLINRRHPRFLARVKPSRLALWSFLAAMAHGIRPAPWAKPPCIMELPCRHGPRRRSDAGSNLSGHLSDR